MTSFTTRMHGDEMSMWEHAYAHPFIVQLGNGSLSRSAFERFLSQDFAYLEALVRIAGSGIGKAPAVPDVYPLVQLLAALVREEHTYYAQAFEEFGVPPEVYCYPQLLPPMRAFTTFIQRITEGGQFDEICTLLLALQWFDYDWACHLVTRGSLPEDKPLYVRYIKLHANPAKGDTVLELRDQIDSVIDSRQAQCSLVFHQALEHRVLALESALRSD